MKLRILEIILEDGQKRYRVQRQWFWFLWLTCTIPGESCTYVQSYDNLEDAKKAMASVFKSRNRSVVQKNIICGGDVVGGDLIKIEKEK